MKKKEIAMLSIVSAGMVMFWKLLDSYYKQSSLMMVVDEWMWQKMGEIRQPWLDKIMMLATKLGNWETILFLSLGVMIWLGVRKKYKLIMALAASNVAGMIFVALAKMILGRERPPLTGALTREDSFALPSGHSYFAVVFWGLLTYFGYKLVKKKWVVAGGTVMVAMIAGSRVYVGVHWLSDVLTGLATSVVWLMMLILYLEKK